MSAYQTCATCDYAPCRCHDDVEDAPFDAKAALRDTLDALGQAHTRIDLLMQRVERLEIALESAGVPMLPLHRSSPQVASKACAHCGATHTKLNHYGACHDHVYCESRKRALARGSTYLRNFRAAPKAKASDL